jgi:hypothetical protein
MPYRSKTKLRKAVTNHSPNRLSRPPSPASPLFDHVGLLVVFFVRLPNTWAQAVESLLLVPSQLPELPKLIQPIKLRGMSGWAQWQWAQWQFWPMGLIPASAKWPAN